MVHTTENFRLLFEGAPNGVILLDPEGRIVLVNAQIERAFGYSRDELIGREIEVLVPERFRGAHQDARHQFQKCAQTTPMGAGRDRIGLRKDGTEFPVEVGLNTYLSDGRPMVIASIVDITERKKAEDHARFIVSELSHRSKNLLAVVQAVASQTARTSVDLKQFGERFAARLDGLACSIDLLTQREWRGVRIEELVRGQLNLFGAERRLNVRGPDLMLKAQAAQNLGLALHELATNATKYGALARPAGKVEVGWRIEPEDAASGQFQMYWRERGGPETGPPKRKGFGHLVIKDMTERALAGEVALEFARQGLLWQFKAPAALCLATSAAAAN